MGANVSSNIQKKATENLTKSMNTFLTETDKKTESSNTIDLRLQVKVGIMKGGCTLDASQRAEIKSKTTTFDADQVSTSLSTEMVETIIDDIGQAAVQENSGINLGQVNATKLEQDISSINRIDLKNEVQNIMKDSLTSFNKIALESVLEVGICDGSDINFSQYASIESLAERISQKIMQTSALAVIDKTHETTTTQTSKQKNEGLFGGMNGIIMMIAIVFIVMFVM